MLSCASFRLIDMKKNNELRNIKIVKNFTKHAAGSVLIKWGDTWVLCTASVEEKVPPFLRDTGRGWVTAEYSMLPSSTGGGRKERDIKKLKMDARSSEIQRLIGRSLRAAVDMEKLGERQIVIDCDVLQADGGTRCASITGGMIALEIAVSKLLKSGALKENPIVRRVAAVSVGVCEGKVTLDLDYAHDSTAEVDLNVVMTDDGRFVEIQGCAEHKPFTEKHMAQMLKFAKSGLKKIFAKFCLAGAAFLFATLPVCAAVVEHALSDGWLFRLEGEAEMREVRVPHDWAVDKGFLKQGACPAQGDLPFVGKGYYKRSFDGFLPPEGGRTYLTLDGVQCRSVIKLNGKVVGGRPFGYASETIDVTDAMKKSGNILEVEAENVPASSRWYPGSGIFRDVTVRVCPKDHVKPGTLFIRTFDVSEEAASVAVSFEWNGGVSNWTFKVENPRLWSPENPALYELEIFGEKFRYGIRTLLFDPARGFFLNGVYRQMRGVCMHHDLGPIGAAFDKDFARRQLALLKEMGCDAIRTSHNPPAAALLDLCDEMGVMVMDEAFDMWEGWKGDYSVFWKDHHARDLSNFIRRDRNHPSIVMWSIGNELIEHAAKDPTRAIAIARELDGIIKSLDSTRPVTFGCYRQDAMWNGCQNTVDVFGANYLPFKYAEFFKRNPKVGLIGTETSSCVSSRGEYFFPVVASPINGEGDLKRRRDEGREKMIRGAQMSGYDLWGPHPNDYPPDVEFEHQERNPQVYGEFVWTGFDYIGEPDPCAATGGRSSYFGIFDLAGLPKDRYWLYKAQWRSNVPSAHILPHWTWPGREGEVTPVHVYTSGDEAELFVNGVSQGRKKRGAYQYRFQWDNVRYQPGELCVKTWRKGKIWATDTVKTAQKVAKVERTVRVFGRISFVTFALKDANGTLCPNEDRTLSFSVREGTRLVSLCNGDAASREDFKGKAMRTFHGLLVAAVEGPADGLLLKGEAR
jgi:beta-galactosidase